MLRANSKSASLNNSLQAVPADSSFFYIPAIVCGFLAIFAPLLDQMTEAATYANVQAGRIDNKIFWPLISIWPILLAVRNFKRIFNAQLPYAILALYLYLAFAGLSVTWAFKPFISLTRYTQQLMLASAIIVPALLAPRSVDLVRRVYACYAVGILTNLFFVIAGSQTISMKVAIGYNGYFSHKNILGEFAAFALFFALAEVSSKKGRTFLSIVILFITTYILIKSSSKTSIALAICLPFFAYALTLAGRWLKILPSTVFFAMVGGAILACIILSISAYDISGKIFGDRTFTGRTEIWDFVEYEIKKRPWGGWGFQSFWLVGLDGPSITDGAGWIKTMPTAHNGYLDIELSTGRIGLFLIIPYIVFTLSAIGRLSTLDPVRGRLFFSIALFIILSNFLESTLLEGHAFQWPLFLLVSVEAARLTVSERRRSAVKLERRSGHRMDLQASGMRR